MNTKETEYQKINKMLYVWNAGSPHQWNEWSQKNINLLVNFCKIHGFTEVNIFVGSSADLTNGWMKNNIDQFTSLFLELSKENIDIYTLFYDNDDPNNIPSPNTPVSNNYKKLIDILINLKKDSKYSGIKGITYDQEPYNGTVYQDFQSRVFNIIDYTHKNGLGFGMTFKMHWLTLSTIGKLMLNKLDKQYDRPVLMDYFPWQPKDDSTENQEAYQYICEKYVNPILSSSYGTIKINIALETETDAFSGGLPVNAFSGDGKIEGLSPDNFFETVVNLDKEYRSSVSVSKAIFIFIVPYEEDRTTMSCFKRFIHKTFT